MKHDLAVAWNWEHDAAFVADLERCCRDLGVSVASITAETVDRALEAGAAGDIGWRVLLDRAWESDPRFLQLTRLAEASGARVLNPPDRSARMGNKAATHALLAAMGVPLPRLVDFTPDEYSDFELTRRTAGWERPLWLKPATAGGGDGVLALESLPAEFPHGPEWWEDRFVLQENAAPMEIEGRPAWFRVIHVFGKFFPFWWHPGTHRFAAVTPGEEEAHGLKCITSVASAVSSVAGLEIFSTEISLPSPGSPLVVDPVNDPVDFRRFSGAPDGVPDASLAGIISALAAGIAEIIRPVPLLLETQKGGLR